MKQSKRKLRRQTASPLATKIFQHHRTGRQIQEPGRLEWVHHSYLVAEKQITNVNIILQKKVNRKLSLVSFWSSQLSQFFRLLSSSLHVYCLFGGEKQIEALPTSTFQKTHYPTTSIPVNTLCWACTTLQFSILWNKIQFTKYLLQIGYVSFANLQTAMQSLTFCCYYVPCSKLQQPARILAVLS